MNLRKLASKAGAAVCAAVSACTVFSSLSAATLTAEAATFSYSSPRKVTDIIANANGTPSAVVNELKNMNQKEYIKSGSNYYAIYTQNLDSNFIMVYNPNDVQLDGALNTTNGKAWAQKYAKYLTTLSRMTGITPSYNVCVLDAVGSFSPNSIYDYRYFSQEHTIDLYTAIMSNKLTHCLLHETAHGYRNHPSGYNTGDTVFDSEEEVNVNIRAICALHWMKEDTTDAILYDYIGKWKQTSGVASQYHKKVQVRPMTNSAYSKFIPSGSKLRQRDPEYTYISEPQYIINKSIDDSQKERFWTRMGALLNYCAAKPIWYSNSSNYNDANNWLNTDKINANWKTISDSEWALLSATTVANIKNVKGDTTYTTAVAYAYNSYMNRVNTKMKYCYNGRTYTVKVTPRVKQWISENCPRTGDVFNISGSLIQAFNNMDILNVNFYGARIENKTTNYSSKDFYLTWFGKNAPGRVQAYTATQV